MIKRLFFFFALFFFSTHIVQSQTIEVNYEFQDAHILHSKLNGFNTGPAMNEIFEATASNKDVVNNCALLPAPFNTVKEPLIISMQPKSDFVDKTAELRPGSLRFPGGTIANYYHLYEYEDGLYDPTNPKFAKGCGTTKIETQAYPSGNVIGRQYCIWDNRVALTDSDENPNYINGFSNLVEAVQTKVRDSQDPAYAIDVIYVANLLTHFEFNYLFNKVKQQHLSPSDPNDILAIADPSAPFELYYKETEDAIAYMMNRGLNVVGVELSNEVYFNVYQNANNNVSPEEYMKLGEIYSARLKNAFPGIKVAVVSEVSNANWTNKLQEYEPAFYDAVVLHNYYNETACINANEPCNGSCSSDLINDRTCRFDCGKCALGNYVKNDLKEIFSEAIEGFPDDKRIWMTEWGIISPNGQGNNLDYFNTLLYSNFTVEHLLEQLTFNVEHNDKIEFSTHHRLGYKINWSVVQQELKNDSAVIRSNFYSFKFLNDVFFADSVFAFSGLIYDGFENESDFYSKSYLLPDDNKIKALHYFSNKTDKELFVNTDLSQTVTYKGKSYHIDDFSKRHYLKGDLEVGLLASNGITQFNGVKMDESESPSLSVVENEEVPSGEFRIPPYSMGVIEALLTEQSSSILNNFNEEHLLAVYPNPVLSQLFLKNISIQRLSHVAIYDIQGQLKWQSSNTDISTRMIDVENFTSGTYFIKVSNSQSTQTLKFMKF